jgi:SAM-dependent methyltransferase
MIEGARGRKFYDAEHQRLVFIKEQADEAFWDAQWARERASVRYEGGLPRTSLVLDTTRRFLPVGSRVLEAGCGLALGSWHLHRAGYDVVALDYAPGTVSFLREKIPEVHPTLGDVRKLDYADGSFDGYWSLGVIEHFYDGWEAIRHEMARVIRPGGILFITFPMRSLLRRVLSRLGHYERWDGEAKDRFYQFALDDNHVRRALERSGFALRERRGLLGLTGVEDAFPALEGPIARVRSGPRLIRGAIGLVGNALAPIAGHLALLVMERNR